MLLIAFLAPSAESAKANSAPIPPITAPKEEILSPVIFNEVKQKGKGKKAEPDKTYAAFDQGWDEGYKTYAGLIGYAREKNGIGASQSTVRKWKIARGLINE